MWVSPDNLFSQFRPQSICTNSTLIMMPCLFVLFYTAVCLYSVCLSFRVCGHSNPVLRAETLVVHCKDDDSTPLINRTFRGHQDWLLICHFVYYPLLNEKETGFIIVFWRHAVSQNYSLGRLKPVKLRYNLLFPTLKKKSRFDLQLWKNKTSLKPPLDGSSYTSMETISIFSFKL